MSSELLKSLGIEAGNPGACSGSWIDTRGQELVSFNPTNGEPIAKVRQATAEDYERVMIEAQKANLTWRMTPAPKRGEIVRQLGEEQAQG